MWRCEIGGRQIGRWGTSLGGGERHFVAPGTIVIVTTNRAHLGRVGGLNVKPGESIAVGADIDDVALVVVEANLPCGSLAILGPTDGGGVVGDGGGSHNGPHAGRR